MSDFQTLLSKPVATVAPTVAAAPAVSRSLGAPASGGVLMDCNTQWRSRPDDERFLSLDEMHEFMLAERRKSAAKVVSSRDFSFVPMADHKGLELVSKAGRRFAPTHYAFQQLATLAGAPAGYLRTLPSDMAADCLNYGFQVERDATDTGLLLYSNGRSEVRAATGPNYGRIWNHQIVGQLKDLFGDGTSGRFRIPGEFGKAVPITRSNTTLFAGDRDMFIFLADEQNRIELPDRRDGRTGSLARGFFVWNSETGARTFGVKTFLFDYVCCNRIVWGADNVETIKIRHTASAPDRWLEELAPALRQYAESSAAGVTEAIEAARAQRIADKRDEFLAQRFGARMVAKIKDAHTADEGRPIETVWDAVTGATAYARTIVNQDERVELETVAGNLLTLATR